MFVVCVRPLVSLLLSANSVPMSACFYETSVRRHRVQWASYTTPKLPIRQPAGCFWPISFYFVAPELLSCMFIIIRSQKSYEEAVHVFSFLSSIFPAKIFCNSVFIYRNCKFMSHSRNFIFYNCDYFVKLLLTLFPQALITIIDHLRVNI